LYIDTLLQVSYDLHLIKKRDTMEKTRFLESLAQRSPQAATKRQLLALLLHADPQRTRLEWTDECSSGSPTDLLKPRNHLSALKPDFT